MTGKLDKAGVPVSHGPERPRRRDDVAEQVKGRNGDGR